MTGLRLLAAAVLFSLVMVNNLAGAAVRPLVWEPLYEPGQGGATVSLAVSPHDPKLVISGGDMLGVARSTNRGELWESTFGLRGYEMADVTFHPTDGKVVWIGSASGPYVSVDAGKNWELRRQGMPAVSGSSYSAMVEKVLYDRKRPGRVLAFGGSSRRWQESVTFGWIWESMDEGKTWRHLTTVLAEGSVPATDAKAAGKGVNLAAMSFNADGSRLYVVAADRGVMISTDGGISFKAAGAGLRHTNVVRLAVHPKDAGVLWVSLGAFKREGEAKFTPGGIYRSGDGGATWTDITANLPQEATDRDVFTAHYNSVAVSPSNPEVLWTNDGRWNTGVIYKSENGGKSWAPVATKQNVGQAEDSPERKALLGAAGIETAANGGCAVVVSADPTNDKVCYGFGSEYLLRTMDGGKSWRDITAYRPDPTKKDSWRGTGWTGWCSTNVAFDPYRKGRAIVQAMDSGRAWVTDDSFGTFRYPAREPHPWLGGNDAVFTKDGRVYITTGHFGQFNGVLRSVDGGKTFVTLDGEARGLPKAGFINGPEGAGVYAHPEKSGLVWIALGGKLMQSVDGGEKWTEFAAARGWEWLAGDPTKAGRFYASAADGVYVIDQGSAPQPIGGPSPAGGGRLSVDATGRVIACQWRNGRTGVWRYEPKGATWTRLLDEHYAYRCVTDPKDATRMLLVTADDPFHDFAVGNGVWVSSDDGKSWAAANEGLPMTRARAAAFDPFDSSKVVIGTYGRGYFTATWPVGVKPVGTRVYVASAEDAAEVKKLVWPAGQRAFKVRNGSMSEAGANAEAAPVGWESQWVGSGKVLVTRDTKVFRSGPGSLRLESVGGAATAQASQMMAASPGERFHVRGAVRSKGAAKVNFAVQFFSSSWQAIGFKQVGFVQGESDWTVGEADIEAPAETAQAAIVLLIEGDGTAWLDDVEIEPPVSAGAEKGTGSAAPAPVAEQPIAVIQKFGGGVNFAYGYGADWKVGENIKAVNGAVRIDTTENGGAGIILNGANVARRGEKMLVVRLRTLEGNEAEAITVKLNQDGGGASVTIPLGKPTAEFQSVAVQLGDGDVSKVQQVQVQGMNFSPAARKLRVEIELIGTQRAAGSVPAPVAASEADPESGRAPKGLPSTPAWGFWPDYPHAWMGMFRGQLEQAKQGNIDVVFLGDSITQTWGGVGKEVWEKEFAPKNAVNFGIGGDSTRQVLYRIENGLLDGLKPKVVVLMIGTNNLYDDNNGGSDAEIAAGVAKVVESIRAKLPKTRVLLLGILPRQNEYFSNRIAAINSLVAKSADGRAVKFLDVGARFQTAVGKMRPEMYIEDQLHLALPGYKTLAEAIRPVLVEMMRVP